MTLTVLPTLPTDLTYPSPIYNTFFSAFSSPPSPLLSILFPRTDISSPAFRKAHDNHAAAYTAKGSSKWQYGVKCIDTTIPSSATGNHHNGAAINGETRSSRSQPGETPERTGDEITPTTVSASPAAETIVGMAMFEIYHRPRTANEWTPPAGVDWMTAGSPERERAEAVLGKLWKKRAELWGGRRYIYCQTLAVPPPHRGRGIAERLMTWGITMSESLSLPIYLESTAMAVPLYEKLGFVRLRGETVVHAKEVLGSKEDEEVPLMVRMPGSAGGMMFEEWRDCGFPEDYGRVMGEGKGQNGRKTERRNAKEEVVWGYLGEM